MKKGGRKNLDLFAMLSVFLEMYFAILRMESVKLRDGIAD